MISVTAPVWRWSEGKESWHFLTIPPDQAVEIRLLAAAGGSRRAFGSVRVEASIDGVTWRTSIFPQNDGGYILPLKAEVRRRAAIGEGDTVEVQITLA